MLTWLMQGAEVGRVASAPLGAAVEFVREAGTLAELRPRYAALSSGR